MSGKKINALISVVLLELEVILHTRILEAAPITKNVGLFYVPLPEML
jgi:hypothetical protein